MTNRPMLTFIGLGLYDEEDVTLKGLRAIEASDRVYAEFYTSRLMGTTLERLERLYDKEITVLEREDVEQHPGFIEEARDLDIVFLTGGDAMVSTTHVDLRIRAHDKDIETRVIHGPSIHSAVAGLTGLQNYRFGKSATIPYPYKDRVSEAPYDTIMLNQENNLHTIIYLDIERERLMTIPEAIQLLLRVDRRRENRLEGVLGVGVARAGSDNVAVKADYLPRLVDYDFGPPLHVLVVPADLHFMEAEALVKLAGAPREILEE